MIIPRNPEPDLQTAIAAAVTYLQSFDLGYGHGTSDAVDDAAWLVLEAAGLSPLEEPDYSMRLPEAAVEQAEAYLQQRAVERIPSAYIVGRTWFAGLEFRVDPRVLIPRSPIAEFLLEEGFGLLEPQSVSRVLDLCTGSGCIAIAAAHAFENAQVEGADISAPALEVARVNVELHRMESRVTLIEADLFDGLSGPYDLLLSNPPYVDAADMAATAVEFSHEPALGLVAGPDGLDIAHRILRQSLRYLSPQGILVCEVGNSAQAMERAYPDIQFNWLEFANGGEGVFYFSASELAEQIEQIEINHLRKS